MEKLEARKQIGSVLIKKRIEKGIRYNKIPMHFNTIKTMEEGLVNYNINNLLEYMQILDLNEILIKIK